MKSAQFERFGLPDEVIKITEVDLPQPGEGEVRIKVSASPINPSDIMFIRGLYGIKTDFPGTAGFEASGEIDEATPYRPFDYSSFANLGL